MIIINNVPCGYQKIFDGKVVFILLHMLIKNKKYRDFYLDENNKFDLIILDNSAFELGESMDKKILMEWAYKLKEKHPEAIIEIVIPDCYKNMKKTLELFYNFLEDYDTNFRYMAVPQGSNEEELVECLSYMGNNNKIHTIGLNKLWNKNQIPLFASIIRNMHDKSVHKLGVNKLSDWDMGKLANVRSCDSRILTKLVTGNDDPWCEKLNETQISILKNLILEVSTW